MALSLFERNIVAELYGVIGKRIREKDLLEWRTTKLEKQPGEQVFHLPNNGVWVAIPDNIKVKRRQTEESEREHGKTLKSLRRRSR